MELLWYLHITYCRGAFSVAKTVLFYFTSPSQREYVVRSTYTCSTYSATGGVQASHLRTLSHPMECSAPALEHLNSFGKLEDREDVLKRKLGDEVVFRPISVDLRQWLDRDIDILSRDPTPHHSADVSAASTPRSLSPVNQLGSMGSSALHSLSSIEESDETDRNNEMEQERVTPIEVLHATVLHETFALPTESDFVSLKGSSSEDASEGKEIPYDHHSESKELTRGAREELVRPHTRRQSCFPIVLSVLVLVVGLFVYVEVSLRQPPALSEQLVSDSVATNISSLDQDPKNWSLTPYPYELPWYDDFNSCSFGTLPIEDSHHSYPALESSCDSNKKAQNTESQNVQSEQVALPRRRWNLKDLLIRQPYVLISRLLRRLFRGKSR